MRRAYPRNSPRYRGTSLIRNSAPPGPYSKTLHRALWWPSGRGLLQMSEVPRGPLRGWREGAVGLEWCEAMQGYMYPARTKASSLRPYRGTSLIRNHLPVKNCSTTMPRLLWRSHEGEGGFLQSRYNCTLGLCLGPCIIYGGRRGGRAFLWARFESSIRGAAYQTP